MLSKLAESRAQARHAKPAKTQMKQYEKGKEWVYIQREASLSTGRLLLLQQDESPGVERLTTPRTLGCILCNPHLKCMPLDYILMNVMAAFIDSLSSNKHGFLKHKGVGAQTAKFVPAF